MRAGSCLIRRYFSKKVSKKKRLIYYAVVNILTFIRRWREILIQLCFIDSVFLITQIYSYIDRISGVRSRILVKLNTIIIDGFNIENFDLFRFFIGKRNYRFNVFWRGSFQIIINEIDGKTTRLFFGIVFIWRLIFREIVYVGTRRYNAR